MTVEHRLLLGLADIVAITFECAHEGCGVRLSVSPDATDTGRLLQCPSCGGLWLANDSDLGQTNVGVTGRLLSAVARLRNAQPKGFRLHLEFAEPKP